MVFSQQMQVMTILIGILIDYFQAIIINIGD